MFRAVLISLSVGLAMTAAACGSSSSSSSSEGGGTTPAVISSATTSTSSSSGSLGGGSSYCGQGKDEIKQLQSKLASVNSITSASDRLKQYMSTLKSAYANAESNAPSQIQPDLAEITTFINKLDAAFAAHNYNLQQSLATAEPLYLANAAKLRLAGTHLKAWAAANCGG